MTTNTNQNYNSINGVLLIDKPEGPTSHDMVGLVRRLLTQPPRHQKAKVGHTGTLDPFATGLLIVAIGSATRLIQFTHEFDKEYEALVILGAESTTDDVTGEIKTLQEVPTNEAETHFTEPTIQQIGQMLKKFTGSIDQMPPTYAAIKVKGRKLYEYAREGETVSVTPRRVTIHSIELLRYEYPELQIKVRCSTGTYIRALARDIGRELLTGAYLTALRRTRIGNFDVKNAVEPGQLTSESIDNHLLPTSILVSHLPRVTLSDEDVAQFQQGRALPFSKEKIESGTDNSPIAVFNNNQALIGVGQEDIATSTLSPRIVLHEKQG